MNQGPGRRAQGGFLEEATDNLGLRKMNSALIQSTKLCSQAGQDPHHCSCNYGNVS